MGDTPFDRFAKRRSKDLQRIARATRGELQAQEVAAEAWLLACESKFPDGSPFDFDRPGADDFLLPRLYQQLVRFTELNVRHAVRLDHGAEDDGVHPLMRRLASDEGRNPLDELERRESARDEEATLAGNGSLAVAYVRLLEHHGNCMREVARHLLISTSWAYRQCARARTLAAFQQAMATPMMAAGFLPGPWRPFRLHRPPVQLAFDFHPARPLID